MSEPKRVATVKAGSEVVGKFCLVHRAGRPTVVEILSVDCNAGRVSYQIACGEDKGKKFNSRFDPNQPIDYYEKDQLVLAMMRAG